MRKSLLHRARRLVDAKAPALARAYRTNRDRHPKRYWRPSETPWGFRLYGDRALAESRVQSNEASVFLELLADADVVVDIGANVGLFTLLAASRGVPVTAIEPNSGNLLQLYKNLELNGMESVSVFPVAVSDTTGIATLYGRGQGASLLSGWGGIKATHGSMVPVHTLDGLLCGRHHGQRLLIKVDAEGHELPILRGATRLLAANPAPAWIVEIGLTENFDGQNSDFLAIFETFWNEGYSAHCVERSGMTVTREDVDRWVAEGNRGFWNINYVFRKCSQR